MNKKETNIDYYQVLRVWPTASEDAVKKAYFSLAKLYHPDVAGKEKEESGGDGVDFKLINEAYDVLSDQTRRRQYDELLKQRGQKNLSGRNLESDKRSGQLAYEQARTAMKYNRYDKAVVLLKSAIKYDDGNAAYYSWYGFALGALKTRLHEARDVCKKALEMEFYNADYHANLGFVYDQAGLSSTARECFREALNWDPEHPLACKHLHSGPKAESKGILRSIKSFFGGGDRKEPSTRKA